MLLFAAIAFCRLFLYVSDVYLCVYFFIFPKRVSQNRLAKTKFMAFFLFFYQTYKLLLYTLCCVEGYDVLLYVFLFVGWLQ